MNKDKQRIAIAEECGWTEIEFTGSGFQGIPPKVHPKFCNWRRPAPAPTESDNRAWYWTPDYLNDLNAMHEAEIVAIKKENYPGEYFEWLCQIVTGESPTDSSETLGRIIVATAKQRAEAFLRIIGKWKNG